MGFIKEFKEFAVKGNMVEMAIGIIIGAAFKDVVDVLVKRIIMPPLSLLTDGVNLSNRVLMLREAHLDGNGVEVAAISIGYGQAIEVGIDFLIVSFVIFLVVRLANRLKAKGEDENDATVKTPRDIELLSKMSKLLEEQNKILEQKR